MLTWQTRDLLKDHIMVAVNRDVVFHNYKIGDTSSKSWGMHLVFRGYLRLKTLKKLEESRNSSVVEGLKKI